MGSLVDPKEAPAEALRLLEEERRLVPTAPPASREWILSGLEELVHRVRAGEFAGSLWVGPKDESVALASWETPCSAGRRARLFVQGGYRNPAVLGGFLNALDREEPLLGVAESLSGLHPEDGPGLLTPLGFQRIDRVDMLFPEDRALPEAPASSDHPHRPLTLEDESEVARLLELAYRDVPVDRLLFQRLRDPVEDAREAAHEILGTGLGTWRADASFGVEVDGAIVAATIVNDFHGPLLAEVMVDPAWRRHGFARRLIGASVGAVRRSGLGRLRLVVTVGNHRAERLYASMGFLPVLVPGGATWLRLPRS